MSTPHKIEEQFSRDQLSNIFGSTREYTTSKTQWLNDTTNRLKIHHAASPQRHVAMNNFPVPSRSKGRSHLQISLMTRRYVDIHMYMLQRECGAPSHVSDQTRMESDDELEQGSETFKIGWFVGVDLETQRYISIQRSTIHSVEAIERVIAFEEDIVVRFDPSTLLNEFGLEEEFMENLECWLTKYLWWCWCTLNFYWRY